MEFSLPDPCKTCSSAPDHMRLLQDMSESDPKMIGLIQELIGEVKTIREDLERGFPGGDIEGHRRYHEAIIQDAEAKKRLAEAIKEKTISGLVWAIMAAGASFAWHYISDLWSVIMRAGGR